MHLASFVKILCISFVLADVWEETPSNWQHVCGSKWNGKRQSAINIDTETLIFDSSPMNFTFINVSHPHSISCVVNTGHTVKCLLEKNTVGVKGGGLNYEYVATELHFHWGDTSDPGLEHTVDTARLPMEMHIVSWRKGLTPNEEEDPEGIAVFVFFIDEIKETETPEAWKNLMSYLAHSRSINTSITVNHNISISDLLAGVDLSKFCRYTGSQTGSLREDAEVWTVFQEPIKLSRDLMDQFSATMKRGKIYGPVQDLTGRKVFLAQRAEPPSGHSWCYQDCGVTLNQWDTLHGSQCGGQAQSPIDIQTADAVPDSSLEHFRFTNFSNPHSIRFIENTGHTVSCVLVDDLAEVEGGGLKHHYTAIQVHFHWGERCDASAGSEHTVDSRRYPMEMHIVNVKKGLTVEEAKRQPDGFAVLGFFMEAAENEHKEDVEHWSHLTSHPPQMRNTKQNENCWEILTSHLDKIQKIGSSTELREPISLDDLLGSVDRSKYYRYQGSLTTPGCNEAVVWTVFKQPIKVKKNLMKMFPATTGYTNIYRPQQPLNKRKVYTSPSSAHPRALVASLLLMLLPSFCALVHP